MLSHQAVHTDEFADVETSSEGYASRFSGKIGEWLIARQSELVLSFLKGLRLTTVLDVAGGHGQLVHPLRSLGLKVTVLGSTFECRHRIEPLMQDGGCSFAAGPLTKLAYADDSYDLVTCIRFLSHIDAWQTVVHEMCRVAKDYVLVDYPPLVSFNFLSPLLFPLKRTLEGNTRTFTVFRHREIDDVFRECGFSCVARSGEFFLPMGLHRTLKRPALSQALERAAAHLGGQRWFGSPVIALYRAG
jgi:hypothetical protein